MLRRWIKLKHIHYYAIPLFAILFLTTSTAHLYAQDTPNESQPYELFLPLVSTAPDPAWSADEREMVYAPEEDIPLDEAIIAATATTTEIAPTSYTTLRGSDGGQPVAALAIQDFPDTSNAADWEKYIEFYTPDRQKYMGYRTYVLPTTIDTSAITALQLKVNYKGPDKRTQRWIWHIYDWQRRKWVLLGDNRDAASWEWSEFTFSAGKTLENYVDATTREVRVRVQSSNTKDDMDLDYEALVVAAESAPPPPATDWWKPQPGTSWQIQFNGTINTNLAVDMYVLDLFDTPTTQIRQLQQQGRKVVCYFSAGSWENWRSDANDFPSNVKGRKLTGWAGERWLDIRKLATLGPIMAARLDLAVEKGCDGVDPDNVDGYTNKTGFPLKANDQLTYNRWLAREAHARGLAIGLKNDIDQIPALVNDFDWQINEQCFHYNECHKLTPFINAGKPVFGLEYESDETVFCPLANAQNFDFLKKNLELDEFRIDCRQSQ